jgi:hypothetical protein
VAERGIAVSLFSAGALDLGVEPLPIDVLDFGIQAGRVVEITPTS